MKNDGKWEKKQQWEGDQYKKKWGPGNEPVTGPENEPDGQEPNVRPFGQIPLPPERVITQPKPTRSTDVVSGSVGPAHRPRLGESSVSLTSARKQSCDKGSSATTNLGSSPSASSVRPVRSVCALLSTQAAMLTPGPR